jgi:hypothetical protein
MSVILDINGQEFAYPEVNDVEWGAEATDWAVAVTSGMLQKAGGLFLLLDDVDFGASYGLISIYYTSRTANAADAGVLRLANADDILWRNFANSGNIGLSVNASDQLTFNGSVVGNFVSVSDTSQINLTLAAGVLSADIVLASIDNSFIAASAAIAVNKLAALTASRAVVSDGSGFLTVATTTATEIGYVNGVTSAIQTQLDAKQASGSYITALAGDVTATGPGSVAATLATVNSNVGSFGSSTSIPSFTVNGKGLITAASGNVVVAPAGTLSGATLAAGVTASSLTSVGTIATGVWQGTLVDLAYGGTNKNMTPVAGGVVWTDAGSMEVTAAGTSGQVLTSNGTSAPSWTSPLTNPMNAQGDIIYGGAAGAATRLGAGTFGQYLVSAPSGGAPSYRWGSVNAVASANYTITTTDGYTDIIVTTGASNRTIDLPAAASSTNRIIKIVKADSGVGFVIIDGNASETINGQATQSIYGIYGAITVICDGSNWVMLDQNHPTWVSYSPALVGFGTPTNSEFYWRKDGTEVLIKGRFVAGTSTATEARVPLPASLTSAALTYSMLGGAGATSVSQTPITCITSPSLTYMTLGLQDSTNAGLTSRNGSSIATSGTVVAIEARVQITGF